MSGFAEELKRARFALGHKTARSFFFWLKERGISFNYSYYMRLEQGGLPSEKVVRELAGVLKGDWSDLLVQAYCRSLFPEKSYLFQPPPVPTAARAEEAEDKPYVPGGQRELTPRQVAAIASHESVYHLFLLATLARTPIVPGEIARWLPAKAVAAGLRLLEKEGLVRIGPEGFEARTIEARFPEAHDAKLKEAYAKFDLWDESFGGQFALEFLVNKMMVRRVSLRYLGIIRRQLETLFDLVRASDEVDTRFNDQVLLMKVVLRQGKLPG